MSDTKTTQTSTQGEKDSPMANLWMSMTGASVGGHSEDPPGLDATAKVVGHEADKFDARTIWYVPALVAITLVVVYSIVQGMFLLVNNSTAQQKDDPKFNDRATRIATYDAAPIPAKESGEERPSIAVAQPRLEFVHKLDLTRNNVNGDIVVDPPYLRSFRPTPTGNSPEIYPEDLRPEHFVDPTFKTKALVEASWSSEDKKVAVIPIDEAIHLMTHDAKYKLKVSDKAATVLVGTQGKAKMSTGGLTPPKPADVMKKADAKVDDHNKH